MTLWLPSRGAPTRSMLGLIYSHLYASNRGTGESQKCKRDQNLAPTGVCMPASKVRSDCA
jgi:hypothetical protein